MALAQPRPELELELATLTKGLEIIAVRRLGNAEDARDVAQETVVRLLARVRAGLVSDGEELTRVAYGIARHVIVDMLRARGREVDGSSPPPIASSDASPLDALVSAEERAALAAALDALISSDRDLLRRCFMDGERIADIARALGEPAERVRKRKSRALHRLAKLLERAQALSHESPPPPMDGS